MKAVFYICVLLLVACSPMEETTHKATANVDNAAVPVLLAALSKGADGGVDVAGLVALTESVSMDEEKQEKLALTFAGKDTTLVYHVWREQADWVHLYFSTPSEDLIEFVKTELGRVERPQEG